MQRQSKITLFFVLAVVGSFIIGCRVQDAGDSPSNPTPASQDNIIEYVVDGQDFVPTQEQAEANATQTPETVTAVAQDTTPTLTPTATETEQLAPSPTPTATFPLSAGQGGNFATFTQEPAASPSPTATGTATDTGFGPVSTNTPFPTATTTLTPTPTSTSTPTPTATLTNTPTPTLTATPTATLTNQPTATPTSTPTSTPTATFSLAPSTTPTNTMPPATATFTPFPAIGGGPSGVEVAQDPTPNERQLTATAFIQNVTLEAQGTAGIPTATIPTATTDPAQQAQPTFTPGADTGVTGAEAQGPVATSFPDCDYLILPGETLSQIARSYNLQTEDVANYNGITNPDFIEAGDTISIPGCGNNPTPTPTQDPSGPQAGTTTPEGLPDNTNGPVTYITQPGDNIYNLSEAFGVTMRALWNANISVVPNINVLSVGEELTIPQRTEPIETATPSP